MSNEFKYTREWTDEGAFPLLGFTKNWENPSDYPTYEPDEMQVRKDMQSLHDEVKNFLNNELIPRVVAEDATVEAWTYAEEQRAANEVTRVANEEQRVANEAARVAAESGRTAAEQARALAEQGRVDSTTGIVAQATEQARAASSSAVYAAESASAASASAAEATQQAGTAFTWASHAEQAANHAAAAANGADDSRIRAEESAGQAAASASDAARSESAAKRYAEQASSAGTGDMLQSVYDPTGKRQDVFKYSDTKISEHNSSTSAHADIRTALDGKAPTGYGLGSSGATVSSGDDLNNVARAGWYVWYSPAPANAPDNLTYCAMRVDAGYNVAGIWCKQTAWRGQEDVTYERRRLDNGTWTAWKRIDGAKIVTGSYTGTGTFGSDGPCSLTFDFEPKIIMMVAMTSAGGDYYQYIGNYEKNGLYVMYPPLLSSEYVPNRAFAMEDSTVSDCYAKKVGNTVYWYHRYTPNTQANTSGCTYHYMAIG